MSGRAPWRGGVEDESVLARVAFAPLSPFAALYALGARAHRAAWGAAPRAGARSMLRPERLPCRVVAVGSVVAGGAGKTPLAAFVARGLAARGHRVAVASRGYGRRGARGREPLVVSDRERLRGDVASCGDEPMWLAAALPGVPVLVARDRARAGRLAHALFATDVLVLDDGLQHHRVERDVAIGVFDAAAGLGNARVLPRGPLREPLAALGACDAIAVVGGALRARDEALVAAAAPRAARFAARRDVVGVRGLGLRESAPPSLLRGLRAGMLCGIASPRSFRASLEAEGAVVVAERVFADHHRFRARDLRGLGAAAPLWLATEKDAPKLRADWARAAGVDVRIVASRARVEPEAPFFDWLERALA
ncbi:MAG: tetraacyldisaccharide 4'-kinase [Myxococcota bacterium]